MAFIGSLVAAQTAVAIGKYNAKVNQQQAAYWDKKAAQQRAAYNQLDRPRLIKSQNREYSNFFVNTLMTGAEFSGTNYAMALANKIEMGTELVIADFNENTDFIDTKNQSILFEQKAMTNSINKSITIYLNKLQNHLKSLTFGSP